MSMAAILAVFTLVLMGSAIYTSARAIAIGEYRIATVAAFLTSVNAVLFCVNASAAGWL